MFFYCRHYKTLINKGKAINYCLKTRCHAGKCFFSHKEFNNYLKRIKRQKVCSKFINLSAQTAKSPSR